MKTEEKKLITKKELCELLGFSIWNIDNMIKKRKIKYYKIGKLVRFDYNEITNFLNGCKI